MKDYCVWYDRKLQEVTDQGQQVSSISRLYYAASNNNSALKETEPTAIPPPTFSALF
jgi:hypothetical protein